MENNQTSKPSKDKKIQRISKVEYIADDQKEVPFETTFYTSESFNGFIKKKEYQYNVEITLVEGKDHILKYGYKIKGGKLNVYQAKARLNEESIKQIKFGNNTDAVEKTGHWVACNYYFNAEKFEFKKFEGKEEFKHHFKLVQWTGEKTPFKNFIKETEKFKTFQKENKTQNEFKTFQKIPDFTDVLNVFKSNKKGLHIQLTIGNLLFYKKTYRTAPFIDHQIDLVFLRSNGVDHDEVLRVLNYNTLMNLKLDDFSNKMTKDGFKISTSEDICMHIYSHGECFRYEMNSKDVCSHISKFHLSGYVNEDDEFDIMLHCTKKNICQTKFKDYDTIDQMFKCKTYNDEIILPDGYLIDKLPLQENCTLINNIQFLKHYIFEKDGIRVTVTNCQKRMSHYVKDEADQLKIYVESMKNLEAMEIEELKNELEILFKFTQELKNKI